MPSYRLSIVAMLQHLNELDVSPIPAANGQVIGSTWGACLPRYNGFDRLGFPQDSWRSIYANCLPQARGLGDVSPPHFVDTRVTFAPTYWWQAQFFEGNATAVFSTVTELLQLTRDNIQVKSYSINASQVLDGLAYDGEFFWASNDGGLLVQFSLPTASITREISGLISGGSGPIDLTFDGENFFFAWGKFSNGISQANRAGGFLTPVSSIFPPSTIVAGITFDGEHLWVLTFLSSDGVSKLHEISHSPQLDINKTISLTAEYTGLVFDGQFLITHQKGLRPLVYLDLQGNIVRTASVIDFGVTLRNGVAFDGEFVYLMRGSG